MTEQEVRAIVRDEIQKALREYDPMPKYGPVSVPKCAKCHGTGLMTTSNPDGTLCGGYIMVIDCPNGCPKPEARI